MPKRSDIHSILVIGAGPIVIGQACEFDYSGSQACKALKSEGFRVVLVNSNPATIMTDPEMADRTYVEPITPEIVEKIIARERPDAILPTMGGQTGLNVAVVLAERGVLDKYGVKMIGADYKSIHCAEDRESFREAMVDIDLEIPRSGEAHSLEQARELAREIGFPVIIRPGFTLGGEGGGVAYNIEEFDAICERGLTASLNGQVLIEESVVGWKEFELEVMRDGKDNVVIICSIENFDAMGVHTGDSITVAPAQTLTDREYQLMRDAAIRIIRRVGVETGGSNIQFAINPENGRMLVIEMNPRVSRSSALASKATGFPIAKFAAKLAIGYTLDEIPNDITREPPASFEPTLDYVVVKIPRFAFEKFPGAKDELTTMMKSVGETMAIGRTFKEALQKGLRGLEIGVHGFDEVGECDEEELDRKLRIPNSKRIFYLAEAIRRGRSTEDIYELTYIDPWFIDQMRQIIEEEGRVKSIFTNSPSTDNWKRVKQMGFSDRRLAKLTGQEEDAIRKARMDAGVTPVFKLVDTCAAEFEAYTPYYYSTYEEEDESRPSDRQTVVILGGGPNRIGQGIEFDYCCCHAAAALRELGFETVMVNSNPETVSTDYDTSDKLYFEPVTVEDVLAICAVEKPLGVIVQLGGQTPLNIAQALEEAGIKILGTSPKAIARAEDRDEFRELVQKLNLKQPVNATATSIEEAEKLVQEIGFPVVVRPSFVLGGRAMEIVHSINELKGFMEQGLIAGEGRPVLIDKFLEDAIEIDVDCVADGEDVVIAGVMEHIEQAGVHSGDSACVLPPHTIDAGTISRIKDQVRRIARELNVRGLMNVQLAIVRSGDIYILEVNPRASRTVPFVSKATGVPWAKVAAKIMVGVSLKEQGITDDPHPEHVSVKEAVLPFARFDGVDARLGPEMRSTGEVMGIDMDFAAAFAKSQIAAGQTLPTEGAVFISVRDADKPAIVETAARLARNGLKIVATHGTSKLLTDAGIEVQEISKISDGGRPNVLDLMKNGEVHLIINTPSGHQPRQDEVRIRTTALRIGVPLITTTAAARAAAAAIERVRGEQLTARSLQEYHSGA